MSLVFAVTPVTTALDLRKLQCRTALTEAEYNEAFENMSEEELAKFFMMLGNPFVSTPETYIKYLKFHKVIP